MGAVFAMIIFAAFTGLNAIEVYYANASPVNATSSISDCSARVAAQNFLIYRNAVENYITNNHSVTGTLNLTLLSAYLNGYALSDFSNFSNVVSITTAGTQIVVYGSNALPSGTTQYAVAASMNDASIGYTDVTGKWTSYQSTALSGVTLNNIAGTNLVSMVIM